PELCAFATGYVRCMAVAEDLVQDVFLQLWMLHRNGETCVNPDRYLYTAVRNRALNYLAHERVVCSAYETMQSSGQAAGMSQPRATADEEVEAAELEQACERLVDDLPTRCREAYVHRSAGKTHAEIAAAMGTSARTAETQVAHARQRLRRDLAYWL
ncbi:MAG: sigma-70 family RNA polymerase sigma factor, partial [Longimicrobiales bacterium]